MKAQYNKYKFNKFVLIACACMQWVGLVEGGWGGINDRALHLLYRLKVYKH